MVIRLQKLDLRGKSSRPMSSAFNQTKTLFRVHLLTNHMEEKCCQIRTQVIFCISCHMEDSSALINMPDAIFYRTEISIGYSSTIPKIQLDICPLEVTLQEGILLFINMADKSPLYCIGESRDCTI